jgi:PAS domain S-box-containing protein
MTPMVDSIKKIGFRLSSRLILIVVAAIITTSFAAGIPAFFFISTELDHQAWARVADGGKVTLALLDAEERSLANIAFLTAQRPTLKRLLEEGDENAIAEYIQIFQISASLDFIFVHDSNQRLLAAGEHSFQWMDPPIAETMGYDAILEPDPYLILHVSQPIHDDISNDLLGFVTVGMLLDDAFTQQLATQTGLEQSFILEGKRISTSLSEVSSEIDVDVPEHSDMVEGQEELHQTIDGASYYTLLMPLSVVPQDVQAFMEVLLPVENLIAAKRRALITMTGNTLLVMVLGSVLGGFLASRLTQPLSQLTNAATNFSSGHLEMPFPSPEEPIEIATLASALEESRINIRRILDDLSNAKAWSETLIQSITEGIVTTDEEGRITSFNQGAEHITGWRKDEVLQRPLDEVFQLPEGQGRFSEELPPHGGKRQIPIRTRAGKLATLAVTEAEMNYPTGTEAHSALVLREITEEEAAQNLRSYFLANISHEFRTPLAAINASVELLLDELEDLSIAEVGELLNSIHMSVSGLQTLIDNMLESLNIEAGHFHIRRRPTKLNNVLIEAIRMMKPLLDRRYQRLHMDDPIDLPRVNIDPTRVTQVVVNLLSNASKYSPIGSKLDLTVEQVEDEQIRISVSDEGPGIPPSEHSEVFRRFVRLDSQNGTQYGIGLGLSVVKVIVEEHGGEVGVENRPGGGSTFWFTLPMHGGHQ